MNVVTDWRRRSASSTTLCAPARSVTWVSNFVGWQVQKAALLAGNAAPIVTVQPQYSLLVHDIELEIVDVCRNEGVGILPWSSLAGGWLTGK